MSDQLSSDLASLRIKREQQPEQRRSLPKALAGGAVVAGLAGAIVFAAPRVQGEIFKTEVTAAEIMLISPAEASVTISSTGYVIPMTTARVGIAFPARVAKVLVKEGDIVKAGDVLIEFDATEQRGAIVSAQAQVEVTRARAEAARAGQKELRQQIERERALVERNVTSRATLEDMEARLRGLEESARASDAEVRAAGAEVESLRTTLRERKIVAPIDGTVMTRPPAVGEVMVPQVPVLELVDFNSLVGEVDVPESRLHLMEVGRPCEAILDAYPSKRYRCTASEIGRRVNRAKATVPVRVKFMEPTDKVLPEMSARVSFLSEALSDDAMKQPAKRIVPESAVIDASGKKIVFVLEKEHVKIVPVKVGEAAPGGLELLEGPAAGTRLVINPPSDLKDGQKVKERDR